MKVDYITHEEAVIQHFIEDPEFANLYLQAVLTDGDAEEISEVQNWYDEAKSRAASTGYWGSLIDNAERTARSGQDLSTLIALLTRALGILKAAVPAGA